MPVAAFDQVTVPAQPKAVKVKVLGKQTTFSVGAFMVGALGFALISRPVTAVLALDIHPLAVQIAVIEYLSTTESVKLEPVAALSLQVTVPAHPLAINVKLEGEQTTRLTGGVIIGAVTIGGWVIVKFRVAVHAFASLTVTVYVPAERPVAVAAVPPDGDQE